MRNVFALTLASLFTISACGDDAGSSGGLVNDRIAGAYCDIIDTCSTGYDTAENIIILLARNLSTADCKTFVKRALLGNQDFDEKILAGTYTVDSAKLNACVSELKATCGDGDVSCPEAVNGSAAIGQACTAQEDCAGDAYCAEEVGCVRKCVARVALGAACTGSNECSTAAGGATCGYPEGKCIAVVRTTNVAVGGECGEIEATDKVTIARCASGLACVYGSGTEKSKCTAPIAAGAACSNDESPCAAGNICLPNSEGEGRTCGKVNVVNTVGAACNETELGSADAIFCNPTLFLGCVDAKCVKAGDGSVGAVCFAQSFIDGQCNKANFCDAESKKCVVRKATGATCEDDGECVSDYCDFQGQTGTCKADDVCTP